MPLAAVVIAVALVLFYCCRPSFSHNVAKRLWRGQIDKGTLMASSSVKRVISTRGTKTLAWLSQLITTCHARPAMRAARPDNSSQSGGGPIVGPQDISTQGGGQTVGSAHRLASIHPLFRAPSADTYASHDFLPNKQIKHFKKIK